MQVEVEHKYLVRKDLWYAIHKHEGLEIRQAYLSADPARTIRIRIAGPSAYLTIKGPSHKASRLEFEYPIPVPDAHELLQFCAGNFIEKVRYKVEFAGKIWEVDEFFGQNDGLILAEIELSAPDEIYDKPSWIGEEVTDDVRYYNSALAQKPYSSWK